MNKFIIIALIALVGCCAETKGVDSKPSRIHLVEEEVVGGRGYHIINVDGHEYISSSRGGIVHSEHCEETRHLNK